MTDRKDFPDRTPLPAWCGELRASLEEMAAALNRELRPWQGSGQAFYPEDFGFVPGRPATAAIQLAIGLQLDLNQTEKLLEKAGFALTRSSKADLVVQYYIERGIYGVTFINEALYDCGLPLLKTGLSA